MQDQNPESSQNPHGDGGLQSSGSQQTTGVTPDSANLIDTISYVGPPQPIKTKRLPLGSRLTAAKDIAMLIVWTFSISIGLCFAFVFLLNVRPVVKTEIENGKPVREYSHSYEVAFELFKNVSSIMAGPLGFVLGFYFRESLTDEQDI